MCKAEGEAISWLHVAAAVVEAWVLLGLDFPRAVVGLEGPVGLRMDFEDLAGEDLDVGNNHQGLARRAVLVVHLLGACRNGWAVENMETRNLSLSLGYVSHSPPFCP